MLTFADACAFSVWIQYGRASESKAFDSRDRVLAQDRAGGRLSFDRLPISQADVGEGLVSPRRLREERSCLSVEQVGCHAHSREIAPRSRPFARVNAKRKRKSSGRCVMCFLRAVGKSGARQRPAS